MKYAIARKINGKEEYLYVNQGTDFFSDDISIALTYSTLEEIKLDLLDWEYLVKIDSEGLPQGIDPTESARAEGKIITEDMVNGNDCPNGQCS